MKYLIGVCIAMAIFNSLKAITIGSEFSFYDWLKYRKAYTDWYFDRETWEQHKAKLGGPK